MANFDVNVTFGTALKLVQRASRIAAEVVELLPDWQRFDAEKLTGELEQIVRQIKRELIISQRTESLAKPNPENPEP